MNTLLDNQEEDDEPRSHRDREITLGTTTILGIFFGLAILCAVFFGFGYSMGTKHNASAATVAIDPSTGRTFSGFKPAPGSPLTAANHPDPYAPPVPPTTSKTVPLPSGSKAPSAAFEPDPASVPAKPAHTDPPLPAPVPTAAPIASSGGPQSVVQIAAVSHQEDADSIVTILRRRGYNVMIRQEPQDKLLHVQVGPFATKKEAEAMRARLLADGFNAYIK